MQTVAGVAELKDGETEKGQYGLPALWGGWGMEAINQIPGIPLPCLLVHHGRDVQSRRWRRLTRETHLQRGQSISADFSRIRLHLRTGISKVLKDASQLEKVSIYTRSLQFSHLQHLAIGCMIEPSLVPRLSINCGGGKESLVSITCACANLYCSSLFN